MKADTESSHLQRRMLRYAEQHGLTAYTACIDRDTIVVIVPWIDASGNYGSDQELAHDWQELREILGY